MNKTELIDRIWAGLSFRMEKSRVEIIVEQVFSEITASLGSGEEAKIRDFGSFIPRKKKARNTRLPGSKELISIPEGRKVGFVPSPSLLRSLSKSS